MTVADQTSFDAYTEALPRRQRDALRLIYSRGLTYKQAAVLLNESVADVTHLVADALRTIARTIGTPARD